MPDDTMSARRLMLVTAGLLALGGAGFLQQGMAGSDMTYKVPLRDTTFEVSTGAFTALGLLLEGFCAAGVVLALRFVARRPGVRGGGIAWGLLGAVASLTMWLYVGLLTVIPPLVTSCLVVQRLVDEESGDWFRRSRR
ncbi:hypothetical protein ACTWP5_17165 [Streptomyces sp. 4N509B]|uniref:hypothetical protein n=1 Tax=Streptomyces sp. 4N509B TaxID=3457413 RepID=UPI003FD634B5